MTNFQQSTIAFEAELTWVLCRELREAIALGNADAAYDALQELDAVAMHSEHASVRHIAEAALAAA